MARFLAFDAIFFLLPFAAYALWLVATRGSLTNIANWQARTIAILALGGAILGKAMGTLERGEGLVLVLVGLQ